MVVEELESCVASKAVRMVVVDGVQKRVAELKSGERFTLIPIDSKDTGCATSELLAVGDGYIDEDGIGTVEVAV
jgi:CTP:molybdopterin cytidylyltransferase MocA